MKASSNSYIILVSICRLNVSIFCKLQSGLCGSVAGGFAAALTTPLDLAKTRIMLADSHRHLAKHSITTVLANIYGDKGFRGLFMGLTPRITIVMLGGFLFFGIYEETRRCFEEYIGER